MDDSIVIGAGLAGCEAAWAIANAGGHVKLYEAKPAFFSPAHRSENFAELVCSNSLKSEIEGDASALLKEELRALGSLVLQAADAIKVPAGKALAVDREGFSKYITEKICAHPNIEVVRKEVKSIIPPNPPLLKGGEGELGALVTSDEPRATIIATGPLTSPFFAESLQELLSSQLTHLRTYALKHLLYFYDAIAPIVEADNIDMSHAFRASRYDVGEKIDGDYINCPLTEKEYYSFVEALITAQKIQPHEFDTLKLFSGCEPIEEMAAREKDFLRHGPMKPVGLTDPATGKRPYAVVQLRQDDLHAVLYNMVGFQTRMTYKEQERVFKLIPALRAAKFARFGSMHRNTYINSSQLLDDKLQLKQNKGIHFAGQITGVEGYMESSATGVYVGMLLANKTNSHPPPTTAIGALIRHITFADTKDFQPTGCIWGIFPPLDSCPQRESKLGRADRRRLLLERARRDFAEWFKAPNIIA